MATIVKRKNPKHPDRPPVYQVQVRRRGQASQSRTFDTKAQAARWARSVESQIDDGLYVSRTEAERTTLAELLGRYAREITPSKKGAEVETYRIEALRRYPLAQRSIATLTSNDLAQWRDARGTTVSPATVNRELTILGHCFEMARKEWNLPVHNPVRDIRRPRQPKARERRLRPGEEPRLMAACREARNPWLSPLVSLALETGMRRSELLALRWEHTDLRKKTVRLLDSKNGEDRGVPLSSRALTVLRTLPRSTDGRVFPTTAEAVKQAWERAVDRARAAYEADCAQNKVKIDKRLFDDLHFHDLRHEATSRFFERRLNPMQVAAITGHKTLQMLKRYTHLQAEDLARLLG